jgi:hypothetical protein
MTITSVGLTQEGSTLSGSGLSSGQVQRSYRSHYRVITDSATTSPKEVETYFRTQNDSDGKPLPYYGRTWKWSAGSDKDVEAICNRFEVSHQPMSAGIFLVEVGYEPQSEENQTKQDSQGKQSDNPADWFQSIQRTYTQITAPVEKAIFEGFNPPNINNPFLQVGTILTPCNSAMSPYDPPLEEMVDITVIRMTRYVADVNDADDWQNYINDRDFEIVKNDYRFRQRVNKWQGWMKHVGGSVELINGEVWWKRDVEFWINKRGWVDEYLDKGFHSRAAPGDKKQGGAVGATWSLTDFTFEEPMQQQIVGKNDIPIVSPVLLDGNGQPLQGDKLKNPVFLKWRMKPQRNLAIFPW